MQFPPEGTPEYKSPPLANDMKLKLQNFAYAMEHATRPSTVGLVVGCNPISLLAWCVHHRERSASELMQIIPSPRKYIFAERFPITSCLVSYPLTSDSFFTDPPMRGIHRLGEKYMEWSDITPSLETILSFTTLYWLTDTYPSSIYTYRWVRT